jgi:hypothetical protein
MSGLGKSHLFLLQDFVSLQNDCLFGIRAEAGGGNQGTSIMKDAYQSPDSPGATHVDE